MPFSITTKLLGFVSGGLGLLLLAASIFGWVQTSRLGSANEAIKALKDNAVLYVQRINADAGKIADRDRLIGTQNEAVKAMQKAADADHAAYQARIVAAQKLADVQEARAKDIMSRSASTQDELLRSREALRLIQEVVADDAAPQPKEPAHVLP